MKREMKEINEFIQQQINNIQYQIFIITFIGAILFLIYYLERRRISKFFKKYLGEIRKKNKKSIIITKPSNRPPNTDVIFSKNLTFPTNKKNKSHKLIKKSKSMIEPLSHKSSF